MGLKPYVSTFACFEVFRAHDQIRVLVAQTGLPVRLIGGAAGLLFGSAGKSHQTPDDIGSLRAMPNMTITRWKLDEYKYNVVPCPFPTLARGLFTTKVGEPGKGEETHKIVARGYDKFFNIGEVPWTTVCILMTAIFTYYSHHLSSGMPFKSTLLHPTT